MWVPEASCAHFLVLAVQQARPVGCRALWTSMCTVWHCTLQAWGQSYLQLVLGLCKQLLGLVSSGFCSLELLLQTCTGRKTQWQHTANTLCTSSFRCRQCMLFSCGKFLLPTRVQPGLRFPDLFDRWSCQATKGLCRQQ